MKQLVRKHIVFKGWVQGVGFRYRAIQAANRHGATGWVRNDPSGSVTMEIQGTEEQIDNVVMALERGTYIQIDSIEARTIPVDENERGFRPLL